MYEIGMYIKLDNGVRKYKFYDDKNYTFNTLERYIYQIGAIVPVIVAGYGCIGLGTVTEFTIKKNNGQVSFKFTSASSELCKNLYNMYRNNISSDDSTDFNDVVIPGAFRPKPAKKGCVIDDDDDDIDFPVPPRAPHFGDY